MSSIFIFISRNKLCTKTISINNNDKEQFKPYNNDYNNGIDISTVRCSDVICTKEYVAAADFLVKANESDKDNIMKIAHADGSITLNNAEGSNITSKKSLLIKSDNINVEATNVKFTKQTLSTVFIDSLSLLDALYPVGSIYTTTDKNFNPTKSFGGTWININEEKSDGKNANGYKFLVATSNKDKVAIGGSNTITINNLPSHTHTFSGTTSTNGKHTHSYKNSSGIFSDNADDRWVGQSSNTNQTTGEAGSHNHTFSGTTKGTGGGQDYWQPYYRVYYWKRTL